MTNPDGYPREFNIILYHGAGSITYRRNSSNRVVDYEFDQAENYAKKFTFVLSNADKASTRNFLNASFAEWSSGTGALALGDKVRFGLYQTDGVTVDVKFKGVIVDISPEEGGRLRVVAYDFSKRLDYVKRDIVMAKETWDEYFIAHADTGYGRRTSGGLNNPPIVPFIDLRFAHVEVRDDIGTGAGGVNTTLDADGEYVEQAFIASGEGLLGVHVDVTLAGGFDGHLNLEIFADNNGVPGFNIATSVDFLVISGPNTYDYTSAGDPVLLVRGKVYWARLTCHGRTLGTITMNADDASSTEIVDDYFYDTGGGRTEVTDDLLDMMFDFAQYDQISRDKFINVALTGALYEAYFYDDQEIDTSATGGAYSYDRILVAYYRYSRLAPMTLEDVVVRLIKLDTGLLGEVNTNLDRELEIFATRGKSVGDCLRELMDLYEDSGSWSGDQHVMAHYEDGSNIQRLKVGQRLDTSNAAAYILSHPADSANTDEHLILGEPRLKKSARYRYASVLVTGKGADGRPLIAYRTDRAKSGSFFEAMSGLTETLRLTDETLSDDARLHSEADRLMNALQRDVWEGEITLTGQHMMFEDDTTSANYGSGKIITLNWSPFGLATTKMKVSRMILTPYTTTIFVNNVDPLLNNRMTFTMGRSEKSESFLAQTGYAETGFLTTYSSSAITTGTDPLYLEVQNSGGTPLWHRVPCVKYTDTKNNLRVYHATIPEGFTGGSNGIYYLKLYTASTGGSLIATFTLSRTVSSIVIDERPEKLFFTRLIVDMLAPNS